MSITREVMTNRIDKFCDEEEGICDYCPIVSACSMRTTKFMNEEDLQKTYQAILSYEARKEIERSPGSPKVENSQTAKADSGKLPMDLVPPQIIRDIAEVRKYGNDKYGDPDNWRQVEKRRYVAALMRHLAAYIDYLNGDDDGKDKESGIEHHKHMACNMAFICEMEKWEEEKET